MNTKVRIRKNTKKWQSIKRNLLKGSGQKADVGWWGGDRQPRTGISVAQVAQWNEEGHRNGGSYEGTRTPARPFIRKSLLPYIKRIIRTKYLPDINRIAMGTLTWNTLHHRIAKDLKEALQRAVLEWTMPPNSAATIKRKGFNDPLIETGKMYDSIKTRVRSING